jgi:uncharacterized protein YbjT (DUF2867 family)
MFFGPEDRLINSLGQLLRFWPVFPLIAPNRKVQPVYYNDVAKAILNAVADDKTIGRTYDLGGPTVYTNEDLNARCHQAQSGLARPHPVNGSIGAIP